MRTGDKAFLSKKKDLNGRTVSLSDFKGKKVLLSFLRTAACPFCNLRVHELIKRQERWKDQGLETIVVFASPASEILQYAGKKNPPFTIIPDPEETLYRQYGIGHSLFGKIKAMTRLREIFYIMTHGFFNVKSLVEKTVMPADFLLDEDGNIDRVYYGKDFGDHIPLEQIDGWASSVKSYINEHGEWIEIHDTVTK
jgi:peroxiredoxin